MERELADSTTNGIGSSSSIRSSSTGKEMLKALAKSDPNFGRTARALAGRSVPAHFVRGSAPGPLANPLVLLNRQTQERGADRGRTSTAGGQARSEQLSGLEHLAR